MGKQVVAAALAAIALLSAVVAVIRGPLVAAGSLLLRLAKSVAIGLLQALAISILAVVKGTLWFFSKLFHGIWWIVLLPPKPCASRS